MATLREKLTTRVQPYLEPGEEVRHVFLAQGGPHPLTILLLYVFALFFRYYIVAVTDRAVVVVKASVLRPSFPKNLVERLPRQARLGVKLTGLWGTGQAGGRKLWIHRRFHKDVAAADSELGALLATAPVASTFTPTHTVPAGGLSAWASPDPSAQPVTTLAQGLQLQLVESNGAWARVVASNGWSGWVDGRTLQAPVT